MVGRDARDATLLFAAYDHLSSGDFDALVEIGGKINEMNASRRFLASLYSDGGVRSRRTKSYGSALSY